MAQRCLLCQILYLESVKKGIQNSYCFWANAMALPAFVLHYDNVPVRLDEYKRLLGYCNVSRWSTLQSFFVDCACKRSLYAAAVSILVLAAIHQETVYPKAFSFTNILIIYAVFYIIKLLLPDSPFRIGFANGLMSESMVIWFLVQYLYGIRKVK